MVAWITVVAVEGAGRDGLWRGLTFTQCLLCVQHLLHDFYAYRVVESSQLPKGRYYFNPNFVDIETKTEREVTSLGISSPLRGRTGTQTQAGRSPKPLSNHHPTRACSAGATGNRRERTTTRTTFVQEESTKILRA